MSVTYKPHGPKSFPYNYSFSYESFKSAEPALQKEFSSLGLVPTIQPISGEDLFYTDGDASHYIGKIVFTKPMPEISDRNDTALRRMFHVYFYPNAETDYMVAVTRKSNALGEYEQLSPGNILGVKPISTLTEKQLAVLKVWLDNVDRRRGRVPIDLTPNSK